MLNGLALRNGFEAAPKVRKNPKIPDSRSICINGFRDLTTLSLHFQYSISRFSLVG
jgi:hypothetical protein